MRLRKAGNRFLIVGLGNPGKTYQNTRHNVGYSAVDYLQKTCGISVTRVRFSSLIGEGRMDGVPVVLQKPTTFMNGSGRAVLAAARYFDLPPEQIVVISDDVHLQPGSMRIRAGGSSGGQKGLQSIEKELGTNAYPRIRIGIGMRESVPMPDYVLAPPSQEDRLRIESRFSDLAEAVALIVTGNLAEAQNRYNS